MKFCQMSRFDPLIFLILVLTLSRVSAEEISPYNFKSDGEWYQEYCWLNGSGDRFGRWTFTDLNKKEIKKRVEIGITLLVVRVNKNGRETETSADILVNIGKIKKEKLKRSSGVRKKLFQTLYFALKE